MNKKLLNIILPDDQKYESFTEGTKKNGAIVLGVDRGLHFKPDGYSRNGGRFYPRELWENVAKDPVIQERLKTNRVLGTIGHDIEIDDKAIREGLVSHYTTNINWNTGYAESYVLDTPTGRIYHAMRRGGVMLYKSTRADGKYIEGKKSDRNTPIVDPKAFRFERVDTVFDPGFLEASTQYLKENYSKLYESIEKDINTVSELVKCNKFEDTCFDFNKCISDDLDSEMSKSIRTHLPDRYDDSIRDDVDSTDDNKLNIQGENKMKDLQEAQEKFYELKSKYDVQTTQFEYAQKSQASLKEELEEAYTKLDANKPMVEAVAAVGGLEALAECKTKSGQFDAMVEEIGTHTSIKESLGKVAMFTKENGDFSSIRESLEMLAQFEEDNCELSEASNIFDALKTFTKEVGTLSAVRETLSKLEVYLDAVNEIGNLSELSEMKDMVEEYAKLGTPDKITEAIGRSIKVVDTLNETNINTKIKELAAAHNIEESIVRDTVNTLLENGMAIEKADAIVEKLGKVTESITSRYNFSKHINVNEAVIDAPKSNINEHSSNIGKFIS